MGQLLLIPDLEKIEQSLTLADEFDCAFEYNEFCDPSVLEDKRKQKELVSAYRSVRTDFSKDTMHGAFYDVTIHSSDPKIREVSCRRVYQSMEIASELGVKGVVFHTGRIYGFRVPFYLEHWKKVNREFFNKIAAEYQGIEIYMENMFDESPDVLAQLAELMTDTKEFGICLDYAHAALMPEEPAEWFIQLAPHIRHMHINDNDLQNDLHLPVGNGKLDWKLYQNMIEKYRLNPSVLIEVKGIEQQKESLEYMRIHEMYPFAGGGK